MRLRTSPGEILKEEFMEPLGLNGTELARRLNVPTNRIDDILRGHREVSAETALRLGPYFGTTARFWLSAQSALSLSKAEAETGPDVEREVESRVVS